MKTALSRWIVAGFVAVLAGAAWAQLPPAVWKCGFGTPPPCDPVTYPQNMDWNQSLNWLNGLGPGLLPQQGQPVLVDRNVGGATEVHYADSSSPLFASLLVAETLMYQAGGLQTNSLYLVGGARGAHYVFTGTSLTVNGPVIIEAGTINHPSELTHAGSGTVTVSANLILGSQGGYTGNYVMQKGYNGLLDARGNTIVGESGEGYFGQSSGTNMTAGTVVLGKEIGSLGTYSLDGGTLLGNVIVGDKGTGKFLNHGTADQGGKSPSELILGNQGGNGTYLLYDSGVVTTTRTVVGATGTGTFSQLYGTQTGTHNTDHLLIGSQTGGIGTYNLRGGTLNAGGTVLGPDVVVYANSVLNYSGGTINLLGHYVLGGWYIPGTLTIMPGGELHVFGGTATSPLALKVNGDVINNEGGLIKVTGPRTTIEWGGNVISSSQYHSDPARNIFDRDLVIGPPGYLVGGLGDVFEIHGGFLNSSTNAALWNTSLAELDFAGAGIHQFGVSGDGLSSEFAWGKVMAGTGVRLSFFDSTPGTPGMVLWADVLDLADGLNAILLDPNEMLTIHFDPSKTGNKWLVDLGYTNGALTVGTASPPGAPEPTTLALLGLGLAGLAASRRRRH